MWGRRCASWISSSTTIRPIMFWTSCVWVDASWRRTSVKSFVCAQLRTNSKRKRNRTRRVVFLDWAVLVCNFVNASQWSLCWQHTIDLSSFLFVSFASTCWGSSSSARRRWISGITSSSPAKWKGSGSIWIYVIRREKRYQSSGAFGSQDVCFSLDNRLIERVDSVHLLCHFHAVVIHHKGMGFVHLADILFENVSLRLIDFIFPFFVRFGSLHNCSFQFSIILLLLLLYKWRRIGNANAPNRTHTSGDQSVSVPTYPISSSLGIETPQEWFAWNTFDTIDWLKTWWSWQLGRALRTIPLLSKLHGMRNEENPLSAGISDCWRARKSVSNSEKKEQIGPWSCHSTEYCW